MFRSRTLAAIGAAALLIAATAPVVAQDESSSDSAMDMEGLSIEVGGVEYAHTCLPTSLPAGSTLTFRNDGAELHELIVARIADDTTESLDELLAMGEAAIAEGKVEIIDGMPLIANPGEVAEGSRVLEREGNYVAICFIPQGFGPSELEALGMTPEMMGPGADPADLPPEVQELMANPPHMALGMIQEFTVTAAGTEAGPLPEEAADEMAEAEDESAEAREETEEEKEEAKEQAAD